MASWSVEVSWVTAMRIGLVPSSLISPSRAAFIMAVVPAQWTFTMSMSSFDNAAMAFFTVLGMSWSFRSRKILCPLLLISLTISGVSEKKSSIPIFMYGF